MASPTFASQLQDFQMWASGVNPAFGQQVSEIIGSAYSSQFGDASIVAPPVNSKAENTVEKLAGLIDSVSDTYLKGVTAYYTAKGKVADLRLAAKGSAATQVVNTAQGAIATPPTNLLLFGGLGLLAVLMLSRR